MKLLLAAACLLALAQPAFGQMVGVSSFTDSWSDNNNIYGSGTTDSPYNNYNHTFRAVTTIVSPSGRSAYQDTGYSSYASAYVSLEFLENDVGYYTVDTDHWDYCPIVGQEVFSGHTGAAVISGISTICYQFVAYLDHYRSCYYETVTPCQVKCKDPASVYPAEDFFDCPKFRKVKKKWTIEVTDCGCGEPKCSLIPPITSETSCPACFQVSIP